MTDREAIHALGNERMTDSLLLNLLLQWYENTSIHPPTALRNTTKTVLTIAEKEGRL